MFNYPVRGWLEQRSRQVHVKEEVGGIPQSSDKNDTRERYLQIIYPTCSSRSRVFVLSLRLWAEPRWPPRAESAAHSLSRSAISPISLFSGRERQRETWSAIRSSSRKKIQGQTETPTATFNLIGANGELNRFCMGAAALCSRQSLGWMMPLARTLEGLIVKYCPKEWCCIAVITQKKQQKKSLLFALQSAANLHYLQQETDLEKQVLISYPASDPE